MFHSTNLPPVSFIQVITQFLKMETLLDDSVEHKVELQIERGGTPLTVELVVSVVFDVEIPLHYFFCIYVLLQHCYKKIRILVHLS